MATLANAVVLNLALAWLQTWQVTQQPLPVLLVYITVLAAVAVVSQTLDTWLAARIQRSTTWTVALRFLACYVQQLSGLCNMLAAGILVDICGQYTNSSAGTFLLLSVIVSIASVPTVWSPAAGAAVP